jgi:hypothetical protein
MCQNLKKRIIPGPKVNRGLQSVPAVISLVCKEKKRKEKKRKSLDR